MPKKPATSFGSKPKKASDSKTVKPARKKPVNRAETGKDQGPAKKKAVKKRAVKRASPKVPAKAKSPRAETPKEAPGNLHGNLESVETPTQPEPVNSEQALHNVFLHEEVPSLNVVHISPEMAPVSKVGGLADVVYGLTQELAIRGNNVEIILPKYDNMRYDHIYGLCESFHDLWVPWYDGAIHCTVYFGFVHERKCFFIEPHSQDNFFNRGKYYGEQDDVWRFAFFSRAAMEFLLQSGKRPDIIHCHDWHTGLVPVYLWEIYEHMGLGNSRVCYTIHNFKHQGMCGGELLEATGLHRPEHYFDKSRLGDDHHDGALNLMKGGIVYSNFVTTVSPTHAREVRDMGQGFGLESTLQTHAPKYGGVLNGIDYEAWNPQSDKHLAAQYNADTVGKKYDNKRALRERLLLADNEKPIIAHIGRLDPQKGLELVRHAIFHCVNNGAQFVLLGSSPEPSINAYFWHLKNEINENPDCHLEIGFDEDLARLIYAGSDMMLVPSRFEPCGLTQLISMRYGTVPVVRAVGGLADTVFDKDYSHVELNKRNGYVFHEDSYTGVETALSRAIACYYQYPDHFRHLMLNAMKTDYSWNVPGQHYLNIYNHIRKK
ncbi:starch synthase [Coraliomargarita sinensis]|uniref:Glycogen synthase n=1 Tax=Coraliomargarita sinensis TaxID=2174842 RepID=A0A317ZM75_9BACT|nr:glycogen synthase [Coraliomargarita sinensis]PXA04491.1 starch synthase [Coraliomargarita sinensis]